MGRAARSHKHRGVRETRQDIIIEKFMYFFAGLAGLFVLYPLIYVTSASLSSAADVVGGRVWLLPVNLTFEAYETIFRYDSIPMGFYNSLWYMVVGTIISTSITMCGAYALARRELVGRNIIMRIFTFTMMFSGGLIPFYLVVQKLGLINTRWAVVFPTALSVWNMFVMRTYFLGSIPQELFEASEIDGANDTIIFFRIVVPLSGPIIAVISLYYAVGLWNSYFFPMIFLRNNQLYPLQVWLRDILIVNQFDILNSSMMDTEMILRKQGLKDLLKYALIVVSTFPLMCVYPFIQKYFVKGVMIGSIKG